ncbi:MAG: type I 3-dehydroquinate dehydratase [Nitrospirae bacterium]|nr:MAG: type I 3-dehydroquinate dehydratase [Nitrospirota bacterium]
MPELYIHSTKKIGDFPLIAGSLTDDDVNTLESSAIGAADIIELRIDMFEKTTVQHVKNIFCKAVDKYKKPIIATIRSLAEGGRQEVEDRLAIFSNIINLADMVDVEIGSTGLLKDLRHLCDTHEKILLGSYHNFESTPDNNFLEGVFQKGKDLGVDIVKIAVTGKSRQDLFRLTEFTLKHRDDNIVSISMGDIGLPSRICSPLCGSLITYGYVTQPTAPGQISISELVYIFRRLKVLGADAASFRSACLPAQAHKTQD